MNESTRSASVGRVLAAICALTLLIGSQPAAAAPDCRGRLQFDEEYSCQFRSDLSTLALDGTLLFEEFDGNAFQATLDLLGESSVAHCTCKVRQPDRFDRAKSFECVTGFGSAAETFEGGVTGNGNEIYKGQLWSADPTGSGFVRFVFSCDLSDDDDDSDADSDSDADDDSDEDSDGEDKVVLCHKGRRTLEVPASAVPDHLAHGDTIGPCESDSD